MDWDHFVAFFPLALRFLGLETPFLARHPCRLTGLEEWRYLCTPTPSRLHPIDCPPKIGDAPLQVHPEGKTYEVMRCEPREDI